MRAATSSVLYANNYGWFVSGELCANTIQRERQSLASLVRMLIRSLVSGAAECYAGLGIRCLAILHHGYTVHEHMPHPY